MAQTQHTQLPSQRIATVATNLRTTSGQMRQQWTGKGSDIPQFENQLRTFLANLDQASSDLEEIEREVQPLQSSKAQGAGQG